MVRSRDSSPYDLADVRRRVQPQVHAALGGQAGLGDQQRGDRRVRDPGGHLVVQRGPAHRDAVDEVHHLVVLPEVQQPADRVQLVGELVGLRAQRVAGGPAGAELALQGGQLGAVAQRGHRADHLAVGAHRPAVEGEHLVADQDQPVGLGLSAGEHLDQLRVDVQLVEPSPDAVQRQPEQLTGAVVDDGDPLLRVECDHALLDAVHQRLAVLDQPGDLGRLHAERLSLDPPREQQRTAEPEHAGHPEVDEQVRGDVAEPAPHRGHLPPDRGDADHPGVEVVDRHLGDHHAAAAGVLGPGPGGPREHPARPQRHRVADLGRVGGDQHHPVGPRQVDRGRARHGAHRLRDGGQPGPVVGRGGRDPLPHRRVGGEVLRRVQRRPDLAALERPGALGERDRADRHQHHEDDEDLEQQVLARQGHLASLRGGEHGPKDGTARSAGVRGHNVHNVVCDRNRDHAHSSRQGRADKLRHPAERTRGPIPCVAPDPSARSAWRSSPPGLALVASSCGVTNASSDSADSGKPLYRPADHGPQHPRRRLRHHRPRRREGDGRRRRSPTGTEVFNLDGAGGTVGLARTVNEKGNGDLAMMMGLGVVGASYTNKSQAKLTQTTPIARLIEESGAIDGAEGLAVQDHRRPGHGVEGGPEARSASAAAPPPAARTTCCRCSSRRPSASTPRRSTSCTYDGGGDLLPAILGDKVDVGHSGAGEFLNQIANGDIRVLATSGDERIEGIDAPTLKDAGIDLVFTNWRGIVAPPGISERRQERLDRRLPEDARDTASGRTPSRPTAGPTPSRPATSSRPSSPSRTSESQTR